MRVTVNVIRTAAFRPVREHPRFSSVTATVSVYHTRGQRGPYSLSDGTWCATLYAVHRRSLSTIRLVYGRRTAWSSIQNKENFEMFPARLGIVARERLVRHLRIAKRTSHSVLEVVADGRAARLTVGAGSTRGPWSRRHSGRGHGRQ